jgi:hypothetical protein
MRKQDMQMHLNGDISHTVLVSLDQQADRHREKMGRNMVNITG